MPPRDNTAHDGAKRTIEKFISINRQLTSIVKETTLRGENRAPLGFSHVDLCIVEKCRINVDAAQRLQQKNISLGALLSEILEILGIEDNSLQGIFIDDWVIIPRSVYERDWRLATTFCPSSAAPDLNKLPRSSIRMRAWMGTQSCTSPTRATTLRPSSAASNPSSLPRSSIRMRAWMETQC